MAISDGTGHEYLGQVEKNGYQIKKLSVKKPIIEKETFNSLFIDLFVIIFLFCVWSCSWATSHQDQTTITEIGLTNVIEIDMPIETFAENKIPIVSIAPPYQKPNAAFYRADQLGIEFETVNKQIVRIWFFSERNGALTLSMPKENRKKKLGSISANDIIRNFGEVNKYENRFPPKGRREAVWAKYNSFGIATNTIDYPGCPYHFGLNWDDTLSYVAVSKVD